MSKTDFRVYFVLLNIFVGLSENGTQVSSGQKQGC